MLQDRGIGHDAVGRHDGASAFDVERVVDLTYGAFAEDGCIS
jgi:hypothetical protein